MFITIYFRSSYG